MTKRILSVGNCGFDHGTINRTLAQPLGAQLDAASTAIEATAMAAAYRYDLILVNRVFDADGDSGLNLIRSLKENPALTELPVMLISNYPQYQSEAQQAGALIGFGKNDLATPELRERLKKLLEGCG